MRRQCFFLTTVLDFSASLEMTRAVRAGGSWRAHSVRARRCVEGTAIFLDDDLRFLGFARNDKGCEVWWELACVREGYVRWCVAAAISLDDALSFLGFARNDKCCEGSWVLACVCEGYVRRCVAAAISLGGGLSSLGFARNDNCCAGWWELASACCQGAEMCRVSSDFP